ncbi:response regulator [Limnobacter alexandrii]|uniref:response regulator n=1 Tax=Limnobacter alexandrii TaxID=2570352 RepID=UPI0011091B32|nr:response regulator [Limnobacter alexandrii]
MTEKDSDKQLPRILVVDDSVVERNLFVHMVAKWGYPVEFASSGQEAIKLIERDRFQLVLADWQMPGMQGTELCVAIRQLNLGQYTYIILMSAQNDEEFLIKALDAGADDVLSKPVDGNELEARLQSAVRRIELQAQLARKTNELAHAHDVIAQDLRAVSGLQRSFLPEVQSPYQGLNYQWLSVPSKYVSGDHLQVFELQRDVYGFYLLDVSGHGIPAAVKSMQLVQMFADRSNTSIVFEGRLGSDGQRIVSKPRDVVARLNRLFQQTESDLSYFTMIYGVFNTATHHVSLCQAGHPSPLLVSKGTKAEMLGSGGYPVGLFDLDDFEDIELTLSDEDALILYSDGVTEVLSASSEAFGEERLVEFVNQQCSQGRWSDLAERIQMRVQHWGGPVIAQKGFEDDVSILMLAPRPGVLDQGNVVDSDRQVPELVFRLQEVQANLFTPSVVKAGKSIVIVDDSRSFLRIFEAMLHSWGYTVHSAKNGHEALTLIEKHQPDLVLTDWDMPGMSGIELCEQVRAQKQNAYTYIIMITGYASRDDLLNSLRVGADDFMTKPVNPSELKVRLKTAERIADLHTGLERRHTELSQLYEALQRDMREVSRIQRALLPKSKQEPWPFAIQTIYQPQGYVCGKQMGLLETQANEHGFFMLNMAGQDTATALQTMALARWFSMARATRVLFPVEESSSKIRRYLASPEQVLAQLSSISPSLKDEPPQFDLLYGLINLDQGTLLVAGIGDWAMVMAQPGLAPLFVGAHGESEPAAPRLGQVIYQGVITPGSRLYFYPRECGGTLGVPNPETWQQSVLLEDTQGHVLTREFSRLLDSGQQTSGIDGDLSLLGIQWRESFEVERIVLPSARVSELVDEFVQTGLSLQDEFSAYDHALKLGEFLNCIAFSAVADTVNIGVLSRAVRAFVEDLAYTEEVCYNTDLVVSEALTNVMLHGFRDKRPEPARLTVLAFQHGVGVLIEDQGNCIPAQVLARMHHEHSFQDDLSLSDLPEGGMGLAFMRMVSQRFVYQAKQNQQDNRLLLLL